MDAANTKYAGSVAQGGTPLWKNEKGEFVPAQRPFNYKDNTTLDMDDFYTLMAAEMQYQDVLNPESNTAEMMNQMVQMSMINAMQDMMTMSMTTYAGSLMGKEVIIADTTTGKMETVYGVVEGVNLYNGTPTIIVNGKEYSMSQIMGLGKAPETSKPEEKPDPEEPEEPEEPDGGGEQNPPTVGGSGDEQNPPTVGGSGDEQNPPTVGGGGDEQNPPTTGGSEQNPPTTGGDEQNPPTTGGDGEQA